jgi:hypothetical protein
VTTEHACLLGFQMFWFLKQYLRQPDAGKASCSQGKGKREGDGEDEGSGGDGTGTHGNGLIWDVDGLERDGVCYLYRNNRALADLVGPEFVSSTWELLSGVSEERAGIVLTRAESSFAALAAGASVDKVSLPDVVEAVARIYGRRKALSLTLQESGTVVAQVRCMHATVHCAAMHEAANCARSEPCTKRTVHEENCARSEPHTLLPAGRPGDPHSDAGADSIHWACILGARERQGGGGSAVCGDSVPDVRVWQHDWRGVRRCASSPPY